VPLGVLGALAVRILTHASRTFRFPLLFFLAVLLVHFQARKSSNFTTRKKEKW